MADPIVVNIEGVGKVNFPPDYTPDRIRFVIENDILPRLKGGPKKPDAIDQGAIEAMKPTKLERFGRGFADVTQGLKQGYLGLKDWATGGDDSGAYTADKSEELARYERGRGPDAGIDLMRLGGNVVATAPAALVPGGQSTLAMRTLAGMGSGAAASGAMFTPEGESKAGQVALGAAAGAAIPGALDVGKRGVRALASMVSGPKVLPVPQLEQEITLRLQQHGLDYNKLTQTVKDSLVSDAQRTLSAGGTLDDVMMANKAAIEAVGAKPTRAAVTRNPKDWQTEKNLRGITGVGEQIAQRDQENARAMSGYLGQMRDATGGKTSTSYETGESAVKAIKAQDQAKEKAVSDLYNAFRETGAQDVALPDTKIAETLGRVADEVGVENIPAAVMSRLKEFGFIGGERTKLLTVNEADKLNRLINNNNPGHGPASVALGRLKTTLNESLLDVPAEGKAGAEALVKARSAAAERFAEQRASKGVGAAIDDVSPDRFVKRFILDADVKDLRGTLGELGKSDGGKQAIQDIKGHIFDNLMLKATGATHLDDVVGKPFSGPRFSKALDAIAPEKLYQIFTPKEIESLRALQKASKLLTEEVPFSDVNYSKTSAALANLILRVGSTPMLGRIVLPIIGTGKTGADWLHNERARKQVAEALVASAGKAAERKSLPVSELERFAPGVAGAFADQPSN